jgi:tRNA-dihydrouridine synthase B
MIIGNVNTHNNVFLAPMAGVTDMPLRLLCKQQGCGLVFTEMVSAKGMFYNDSKSFDLTKIIDEEKPAGVQIFGSDPVIMAHIADKLNDSPADIIDINMGCPTPKITKNGEGCALMLKPELAAKIIKEVSVASIKPVTVKIRKGWDASHVNAVEIAKIAEDNGAKAITVHGRTRNMFYSGSADRDIIKKVKESVSFPVIGNGDIFTPRDAFDMLNETGCDAVMVGRGAQGNPWIFKSIIHFLITGEILPSVTPQEKAAVMRRHMELLIEQKGEYRGVLEMRKHMAWYVKGKHNAAMLKQKAFKATSAQELLDIVEELLLMQ